MFTLLPVQCAVCKSCVVFALLPTQCTRAVCVSPVLSLLNVLPAQFAVRGLRHVLLLLFYFAIFKCTTASTVCCACKSYVVFAQCTASTVCRAGATTVLLLLFYFAIFYCTTVCFACKSYVVFALLPVHGTVCVSTVLCLHYCQRSVLCV